MKYYPPLKANDPDAPYTNGNEITGEPGSHPDARGFEATQREIVNAIIAADIEPDGDDMTQFQQAINKQITQKLNPLASHVENLENPHHVTKAQIGLENVNNTADMDKPISTAVQLVLDNCLGSSTENLTAVGKANIFKATSPKYTVEESRTWGTEYTATIPGFVAINCNCAFGQESQLLINGVLALKIYQLGSVTGGNKLSAAVNPGDKYKGNGQAGTITFWSTY